MRARFLSSADSSRALGLEAAGYQGSYEEAVWQHEIDLLERRGTNRPLLTSRALMCKSKVERFVSFGTCFDAEMFKRPAHERKVRHVNRN